MFFLKKKILFIYHVLIRILVKTNLIKLKDYRYVLFDELNKLKNKRNLKILEIGPKDGEDTKRLLKLNPKKLILVELPDKKKQVDQWIKQLDNSLIEIIYENIMYENTILDKAPFDIIWCTGVLYHNPEQLRFLKKLFNIIKPGGHLVLETATARKIGIDNKIGIVEIWDEISPHIKKKYHLSKNISHLPNKAAVKIWLGIVGFEKIRTSKCYRNDPLLGTNRAAFIATKPITKKFKKKQTYYNIANLNYEIGESK